MQRGAIRVGLICSVALAAGLALSCTGGGGGPLPPVGGGFAAVFTPANPSPGANTLNMGAGMAAGDLFDVEVRVTGITDFFGTAFRITYDPATVTYLNSDSTGSFLAAGGTLRVDVAPGVAGELLVDVTLLGQVQGVTVMPTATELLLTLSFQATGATAGNGFDFGLAANRVVRTCPAPPTACADLLDTALTWSGGTMTAN